ncbi:MAG: hypothetical protein AB1758_35730, partial [Candidatus Eremiobacterota bacterium]
AGVGGSVWANEKLKKELPYLEQRYWDSMEERNRLPQVINLFEKPQQELEALRAELETAKKELQELEVTSAEVLTMVDRALETSHSRLVELRDAIQVGGVRIKKKRV